MTNFENSLISANEVDVATPATFSERIDFIVGFLRRRYISILFCLLASLPFGALYLRLTPATYTASTTMMMETRPSRLQESLMGESPADPVWLESQIGVLRSLNVSSYVVKQLRLADDPKFVDSDAGLIAKILARFGKEPAAPKSEAERVGAAIREVSRGLDVRRAGHSVADDRTARRILVNSH